mmetsp:Transcript_22520/g.37622  ORF Transcript_22520/g.37622 Transcript_22520/m.37622 type:complete len:89 (+) Transcript_22520:155-421(+)
MSIIVQYTRIRRQTRSLFLVELRYQIQDLREGVPGIDRWGEVDVEAVAEVAEMVVRGAAITAETITGVFSQFTLPVSRRLDEKKLVLV